MLSPEEYAQKKAMIEERREIRRHQERKNFFKTIFLLLLGLLLMSLAAYYSYNHGSLRTQQNASQGEQYGSIAKIEPDYERIHIMFFGTDDKGTTASRTDTIFVASLNPDTGNAGILSIPRDTRIYIEERGRWDRVNAIHAYGGPEFAVQEIASFLGIEIDYYLETDFAGFSRIIDTLGGVEIYVERDMKYTDTAQDLYIDIRAGNQVLNGDRSLQYVRYRDSLGDVSLIDPQYDVYGGRVERQRKFLMALLDEVLQPSTILKLPRLISQVWDAVETNVPWTLALRLAFAADRFTVDNMETAIIPGNSDIINGASYWVPDTKRLQNTVDHVIYGIPLPITVEILNGSGVQGAAAAMRDMLAEENVEIKRVGNADHFSYFTTQLVVNSEAVGEQARWLSTLLDAEVVIDPNRNSQVDLSVIIGRDFQVL